MGIPRDPNLALLAESLRGKVCGGDSTLSRDSLDSQTTSKRHLVSPSRVLYGENSPARPVCSSFLQFLRQAVLF